MRVKVFKEQSPSTLESKIQDFLDTKPHLDDNQKLIIHNIKYSIAYSETHGVTIFSALIIYNGKNGKAIDN